MKRASLSALEPEDLIAIVLSHPLAGRHVAYLLENYAGGAGLASSTVVFHGRTVCLRTPGGSAGDPDASVHLLVWHEDHMHPWRVDAVRVPRDAAELRLLAMAVSGARRSVVSESAEKAESKAA